MAKLSQTLSELSGQVAIVTGSSKGIGRAIAERLAQHGSRVVLSSRTPSDCQALAEEVNARHGEERAIWTRCDAGDRADLAVLIKTAMERWGRIDTVVGNALVSGDATAFIERFDEESFTAWFDGNVTNNAYLTKLVSPIMRAQGGGSIVFVSSSSGIAALEDYLGYGTSKAALNHLARTLAVQLGPHPGRAARAAQHPGQRGCAGNRRLQRSGRVGDRGGTADRGWKDALVAARHPGRDRFLRRVAGLAGRRVRDRRGVSGGWGTEPQGHGRPARAAKAQAGTGRKAASSLTRPGIEPP